MRITALAGGIGGARFLRGLLDHVHADPALRESQITIIGNTGDDITLFGLRVCPDLDTLMYTIGDGIEESQGWGRRNDTRTVQGELAAYGGQPQWFGLGDLDFATHIVRSQWLGQGLTLSEVTGRLAQRWGLAQRGVTLLPMSDEPVETHVVVDDQEAGEGATQAIHFQQWWVGMGAGVPARAFHAIGIDRARPAPGVLEAIRTADVVLLPPSNPVVSIGIVLSVPGVRDALRGTSAPVVAVSPIVGGAPVRGHADACLAALGLPTTPEAVAGLYADFLDGWLVAPGEEHRVGGGVRLRAVPLLMRERESAARLAGDALSLGVELRAERA
ncbi:LPPG:FO 2-phospho-L-lactate transferase [Kineosphaera limosa]|uniref:LPPG--Fo 2-phospho-L-lactate transferase n=1 Tax=Kineosphaera limosa NBRC 100340 TaxID=1184609 RepID=K6WZ84_9MICO|nr:2-phospho-L-lactate transferase [Kineosphaera limosa]NYE02575.1 LPPG:FO 2-phospho-L-lactate transferase [Kineosphaera limosa]GAB97412.1 LPPG--Fo 2-phospho-L-lactate transferase [Kineosphaera limosa NBRC 100340]